MAESGNKRARVHICFEVNETIAFHFIDKKLFSHRLVQTMEVELDKLSFNKSQ